MKYVIEQTSEDVPLVGSAEDNVWSQASVADIDVFPWDTGKKKQKASVRMLYDHDALYLQYRVKDEDINADVTTLNGPVYRDSAVECFAAPFVTDNRYFNLEINCIGTIHLGWGPNRSSRESVSHKIADSICVTTSENGSVTESEFDANRWWLTAVLPFNVLSHLTGREVSPSPGTVWKGNFQRLGGESEFAVWSPIEASAPDFHRPESFGYFAFAPSNP